MPSTKHDIHAITGLPPGQFSDSQDWITIANGLMIIVGAILAIFFIAYIISFLFVFTEGKATVIARMIGGFGIVTLLTLISNSVFSSFKLRREIIAFTNHYANSSCNVEQQDRVAYLGKNKISIAYFKNEQWNFKQGLCKTATKK